MRSYWRIYWPSQLVYLGWIYYCNPRLARWLTGVPLPVAIVLVILIAIFVNANVLWVVLPRLWNRDYRGFAIVIADVRGKESPHGPTFKHRCQLVWAIIWRQIAVSMVAAFAALPIFGLLSMAGIRPPALSGQVIAVLFTGPIIMNKIIGTNFSGIQLEVRRDT